jgi:hypothetical protein
MHGHLGPQLVTDTSRKHFTDLNINTAAFLLCFPPYSGSTVTSPVAKPDVPLVSMTPSPLIASVPIASLTTSPPSKLREEPLEVRVVYNDC